jgi:4-hydroxy-tetrahydrodipicolinate synthase
MTPSVTRRQRTTRGRTSALVSILGEIARHIIDAFVAKDHERAATLQLQFALFPSKWMHRGLAPVMKAAMNLIGVPVGDPYPPYASLSDDEIKALAAVLRTTVLAKRFSVTAAA